MYEEATRSQAAKSWAGDPEAAAAKRPRAQAAAPRDSAQPSFSEQNTSSIIANREGHEFTRAAVG